MSLLLLALLNWQELPPLPRAVAGQYVGTVGEELVVAGGTYWEGKPWSGGKKHWVREVYRLGPRDKRWREAGMLPEAMAYGATISVPGGMLLIGGQSGERTGGSVWRLGLVGGKARVEAMPALPCQCGWVSGAALGDVVYVAGGGEGFPSAVRALRGFWRLDLKEVNRGWVALDPWPGRGRFLAAMGESGGSLFLAGGADLEQGKRVFLRDAYRYQPGDGWKRIADLPVALQGGYAAPGESVRMLGGNDGEWGEREADAAHPGFRREVYRYDATADRWSLDGMLPVSLVTSGLTVWRGRIVIAGGEDRPASRSARVITTSVQ